MKGLLIVISGPSGAGKGTVIKQLMQECDNLKLSISCTTREPRAGEQEGVHYFFKTKEEFRELLKAGGFLEYATVHGELYGTPISAVREMRAQGYDVLLEIDVQGAAEVRRKIADAALIFIAPPSIEELSRRLAGRNTESEEQISLRMSNAFKEMELRRQYDYVVVNDTVEHAEEQIRQIISELHEKQKEGESSI